jgi:hypothetical protein
MDIHTTKIYRPSTKSMLLKMSFAIIVIAAVGYALPYESIQGLVVIPAFALFFCLVKMLTEGTEVVAIASTKVEQGKFFGKQVILLKSIQYIRSYSHFGLKYIVIETDKETFKMGGFLSAHQKKAIVANIMEHLRVDFPENFAFVKHKVDRF